MQSPPAAPLSRPAPRTNKVLLLNSDYQGVKGFQRKFSRRFPAFSVITHVPTSHLDGGLAAMAAAFASKQAKLLVVCKPEAAQAEICRARALAGDDGVDVYQIFLCQDDFFVRATSSDIGDRFVWISEKDTRMCDVPKMPNLNEW
jgi:hypothetical protein